MRNLGWVEAQNVKIEPRYADREDRLPALAAELVRIKVDIIMTNGTPATRAAREATKTIPIAFVLGSDPVENGFVASMARPGGNLTGFAIGLYGEKQMEILKEALPRVSRIAVPNSSENAGISRAAKALGVQVQYIKMRSPEDFGPFYTAAETARADAVLIPNIAWLGAHLERIATEANRGHLPAIGYRRIFAESGGLMSYGPTPFQEYARVAAQVDKILRGTKPADIPVEQPTKFDLVINLKTAKALGLTIAPSVLLRADEVIQ